MLASSHPHNPTCRLEALSIPGLLDAIGLFTDEELVGTEHCRRPGFRHNPVSFFLFLHPCRLSLGAANQAEIFGTAERAEMADVEQTQEMIPFITCEISLVSTSASWFLVSMYLI